MKILITGAAGFAGSSIARALREARPGLELFGIDNFSRPGSELNRTALAELGVRLTRADIRNSSDFESLPAVDWVIDAAANPSVLAGVDGKSSSRQLVEHNLGGTINILEYCKRHGAGFILLSTSRVYSIEPLAGLPLLVKDSAFVPDPSRQLPPAFSVDGITESFSTAPPISLYGATKLASEALALEYGLTFNFPVRINRCGVLAGPGQFGRPDQGIFAFWILSWLHRRNLSYVGFGATGHQVRDCLHPRDLSRLLLSQLDEPGRKVPAILNVGGGLANSMSLSQLSAWCSDRLGSHTVSAGAVSRPFDLPWVVLDSSAATLHWSWKPGIKLTSVLEEIAAHSEKNPHWLDASAP